MEMKLSTTATNSPDMPYDRTEQGITCFTLVPQIYEEVK